MVTKGSYFLQLMCAMGLISQGGNTVTPRFMRHFNILCIDEFQDEVMIHIFSKIMLWHLDTRYRLVQDNIVSVTVDTNGV